MMKPHYRGTFSRSQMLIYDSLPLGPGTGIQNSIDFFPGFRQVLLFLLLRINFKDKDDTGSSRHNKKGK